MFDAHTDTTGLRKFARASGMIEETPMCQEEEPKLLDQEVYAMMKKLTQKYGAEKVLKDLKWLDIDNDLDTTQLKNLMKMPPSKDLPKGPKA